jgi:hypothetical protein
MNPNRQPLRTKVCIGLTILASTIACGRSVSPVAPAPLQTPATVSVPSAPPPGSGSLPRFTVSGIVVGSTATGTAPIDRAYVEACGYDSVETNGNGFFTLTLPGDALSLFIQKPGYRAVSVLLNPAVTTPLDVRMERE